jgi:hypothetical protein
MPQASRYVEKPMPRSMPRLFASARRFSKPATSAFFSAIASVL